MERGGGGMNWEARESKRGGGTKKGGTRSSEGRKRVQPKTMDKREKKKAKRSGEAVEEKSRHSISRK